MTNALSKKIDYKILVSIEHANPNGDPLDNNRPRIGYDGRGEISDVCIKRKIRNRMQDLGEKIYVQSADRCDDGMPSLSKRLEAMRKEKDVALADIKTAACAEWLDVRSFGALLVGKGGKKGEGLSIGIRGPVTVQAGISVSPVEIISQQIVKSVNGDGDDPTKRSSDTMGTKYHIPYGLYEIKGSINPVLAARTGFCDADADLVKRCLSSLFENDESSARPSGSMRIESMWWWEQEADDIRYPSHKVMDSVSCTLKEGIRDPRRYDDYVVEEQGLGDGITVERVI